MNSSDLEPSDGGEPPPDELPSASDGWLAPLLDVLGWPAVLVDRSRRVIAASESVERLQTDVVAVRLGRLGCDDRDSDERLDAVVRRVAGASPDGDTAGRRQTLGLASPTRDRSVFVTVARFALAPVERVQAGRAALALVTIHDPQAPSRLDTQGLADLFSLTPGELRIAEVLVDGLSPHTVAERLHLSEGTVRTHLRAIFRKTSTHRQAELVRLLTRFRYP